LPLFNKPCSGSENNLRYPKTLGFGYLKFNSSNWGSDSKREKSNDLSLGKFFAFSQTPLFLII
jgi:hypothetical protein